MFKAAIGSPSGTGTLEVLDISRAIGSDDAGPIVSIHDTEAKAQKSAKGAKNAMVVELKPYRTLSIGDHIPLVDIQTPLDRVRQEGRKTEEHERITAYCRRVWGPK
jgi:hypothetical protein